MNSFSDPILRNGADVLVVGSAVVSELKVLAARCGRRRSRLLMHHSSDDLVQEMLIAFQRGSFMPPHRHPPGKSESYHIIEGEMDVCLFDDEGALTRVIRLAAGGPEFMYRVSGGIWHMPLPVTEWIVYHEVYTGPFRKDRDVEFPVWAPDEADAVHVRRFLSQRQLLKS